MDTAHIWGLSKLRNSNRAKDSQRLQWPTQTSRVLWLWRRSETTRNTHLILFAWPKETQSASPTWIQHALSLTWTEHICRPKRPAWSSRKGAWPQDTAWADWAQSVRRCTYRIRRIRPENQDFTGPRINFKKCVALICPQASQFQQP